MRTPARWSPPSHPVRLMLIACNLLAMLTRDQLAARAEALPDGLPGEDLYARLFEPGEESFEQFKHDLIGLRRQAWQQGKVMRRPENPGSKARIKKIREYMAWLKAPVDAFAEPDD